MKNKDFESIDLMSFLKNNDMDFLLNENSVIVDKFDKRELKSILNGVDNVLFEEKVFKLRPEDILEISNILEELV